jgi:hypothetical protein
MREWLLTCCLLTFKLADAAEVPKNAWGTPMGAFECPCSEEIPQVARSALELQGYPRGYGEGCNKHDDGNAQSGCGSGVADPPSYCSSPWCYVDAEKCLVNERKCLESGAVTGSNMSPYCRSREMSISALLNASQGIFYSYHTCGAIDRYTSITSGDKFARELKGSNIVIALTESKPWTFQGDVDPKNPEWKGWTGVLVHLIDEMKKRADLNITVVDYFASIQSQSMFSSDYTACVLDVAVGKTDLCLSDFWVTPQR